MYEDLSTDQTYLENVIINAPSAGSHVPEHGWGVDNGTMVITTLLFDRMFPAFTTVANETASGLLRWRLGHPTDVRTKLLNMNPWLLPHNITRHFERLATALTNVVRSDANSNELLAGDAFIDETYVAVHWAWLTFPLAMLAFSTVFLIATVIKTSEASHGDMGVWKTSAMPTLIYSLPQDVRHNFTSTSTWRSESGGAKKVKIRLKPDQGWRVSGHVITSPKLIASTRNRGGPPGWL
jgi:hypothetical protein